MGLCDRSLRRGLAVLLSLGLFFAMTGTASAHVEHAKVSKAIPAIGSTITQVPATVTVFTLENMNPDPKNSNLFVYGPGGALISQGDAKVSLSNPQQMSVTIKPDGNGIYVVQWKTVSALDGDPDQGAFVFTVKPGVHATPTTAAGATTPPPTASGTGGIPLWVPFIVGELALLIGLGSGLSLGRRSTVSSVRSMRRMVAEQQRQEDLPTKHS